jgi:hypothetical protein
MYMCMDDQSISFSALILVVCEGSFLPSLNRIDEMSNWEGPCSMSACFFGPRMLILHSNLTASHILKIYMFLATAKHIGLVARIHFFSIPSTPRNSIGQICAFTRCNTRCPYPQCVRHCLSTLFPRQPSRSNASFIPHSTTPLHVQLTNNEFFLGICRRRCFRIIAPMSIILDQKCDLNDISGIQEARSIALRARHVPIQRPSYERRLGI